MATAQEPKVAKYFTAFLTSDAALPPSVQDDFGAALGTIDGRSEPATWTASRFYEREIAANLLRGFFPSRLCAGLRTLEWSNSIANRLKNVSVARIAAGGESISIPAISLRSKSCSPRPRMPTSEFISIAASRREQRRFITAVGFIGCGIPTRIICGQRPWLF